MAKKSSAESYDSLVRRLGLVSIQIVFIYTLGLSGAVKLLNWHNVMAKYIDMFNPTFVSHFPGTVVAIYATGGLEIVAALLFIASIVRREFLDDVDRVFLNFAFLLALIIFAILGFGLKLLAEYNNNHAATFQMFGYTLLTFIAWRAIMYTHRRPI
ncbi:hypothetical protein [Mycobacteroides abscessus]|uniref:DoxX family protein n=3 Tax=Mycobacteroides abscessus TaxID=36809 RepID=B1MIA0_MYCA9|nr:hypothetical protein [Mycobacteroides abscessus]ALM15451.1 hypothetical protein AOY11_03455 [Mycobacteroides abscessus]AMU44507.1 hypothetical protein A3O00_04075 [Mycobacteroides abscessus]AMU49477.1 hypothetical protein A3O01_04475 [Mycobacteroides abscessus]ANO08150.1 hypothetical protein BAB76_04475 [Mycobacteroides abscessus]ANO17917.1 hypothetical protein BAB78_04505 [Mycobacteroides abscessus]